MNDYVAKQKTKNVIVDLLSLSIVCVRRAMYKACMCALPF